MQQIEIIELFRSIRYNKRLFVLIPFVICLIVTSVSLMLPKKYESSATIYINAKVDNQKQNIDYSELMAGQLLVRDCKEVVKQRGILEQTLVALELQNKISVAELASKVSLSFENNTRVAKISVMDKNPIQASKLANKLAEIVIINVAEVMNVSNIKFLDKAVSASSPSSPQPIINGVISFIAGLVLSFCVFFLKEYSNNNIKNEEHITHKLKENVFSIIPKYHSKPENMILYNDQEKECSELFRILRTNIKYSRDMKKYKKILVTSVTKGEGKSFVALSLSLVMAMSGYKVALVDADMENPSVGKLIGIKNDEESGLSCVLTNVFNPNELIKETFVNNLHIVNAGNCDISPCEIFESFGFQSFDKYLAKNYDIVIYDGTSIENNADGLILSTICDGVLFVLESGKIDEKKFVFSINNLKRINANIIGIVLNKK